MAGAAEAAGEALPARVLPATQLLGIRPGTAFIIMMMDPDNLELEVRETNDDMRVVAELPGLEAAERMTSLD